MENHPGRSRRQPGLRPRVAWMALALAAAIPGGLPQAATFGHARMASADGAPLLIVVPVSGLTQADSESLSAGPAPESAWTQAGLVPPVALKSLQVTVAPAPAGGSDRVLRIHSSQVFSGPLADLLLDVRTASGSERYQVSLVTAGPAPTASAGAQPAGSQAQGVLGSAVGKAPAATGPRAPAIVVRKGDTMFAIARRHSVRGVSIYQLMLALQRANPQAFIHQNINLVRAGSTLAVPDLADMLSISDAEARRQFVAQTAAFNRLRHREGAQVPAVGSAAGMAAGSVSHEPAPQAASPAVRPEDQLRLSEGGTDAAADERASQGHALKDAESRIGQLEQNVQTLSQALQAQGQAAGDVAQNGAGVIAGSIRKIAGAISEASHEAAAQADDRTRAAAATPGSGAAGLSSGPGAAGASSGAAGAPRSGSAQSASNHTDTATAPGARAAAAVQAGAAPAGGAAADVAGSSANPSSSATSSAANGPAVAAGTAAGNSGAASPPAEGTASTGSAATSSAGSATVPSAPSGAAAAASAGSAAANPAASAAGAAGAGSSVTAGGSASSTPAAAASGAAAPGLPGSALGGAAAGGAPVTEAQAHANAEAATHEASLQTRHRVSWLQDHLLGVMTALLALIVFVIAWLLRRASAGRDDGDDEPQVTAAMVREKLEGVDLNLPPADSGPKDPDA